MSRRYSFEDQQPERLPRGNTPQPERHQQDPIHHSALPQTPQKSAAILQHPDAQSSPVRGQRTHSREREASPLVAYGENHLPTSPSPVATPSSPPPKPPPHRDTTGWLQRDQAQTNSAYSNVTTGADNFSEHASGGLTGVAMNVADQNARESGVEAMRHTPGHDQRRPQVPQGEGSPYGRLPPQSHQPYYDESQFRRGSPAQQHWDDSPYQHRGQPYYEDSPYQRPIPRQDMSQSSLTPLGAAAFPPGSATPSTRSTASRSPHNYHDVYSENSYRYSRNLDPALGAGIDPNMIADDGDDGVDYGIQHRRSFLSMGNSSERSIAPGAAGGGVLGSLGGFVGRSTPSSTNYDPVRGAGGPPKEYDLATGQEKAAYLKKQQSRRKRRAIIIGVLVGIIVIGGLIGGTVGGLLAKKGPDQSSRPAGTSAQDDKSTNGDLSKNSAEIKALMNNKNLHKVFPGMDYTPMNTQYPDCQTYPASQNNVTRDIAVLSQLTNIVRLYGTDCNATQMVIHAIDQLGLKGTMKIWLGVWQDKDLKTNARQLKNMYDIFDKYGSDHFLGIILGNEVLYRGDFTIDTLGALLSETKANLTARGISLPIASSDLGDDWKQPLANEVDYVMANIHPFFTGNIAEDAASWTWSFWQNHNIPLKADKTKHIISEVGWPSAGGKSCGAAATCALGSVAGVDQMNIFLEDWVCPALNNGTNYFWFSAFDEGWKVRFNEPGKEWEDKWGLMDMDRNLKPNLKIPDCGGQTVDGRTWM